MAILAATVAAPAGAATGVADAEDRCRGPVEACREDTIGRGELTSPQVEDIQRTLQDVGYGVRRTGKLDDQTRGAISRFQRDRGLPETGALDGRTASQLGVSRRGLEAERMEHGT